MPTVLVTIIAVLAASLIYEVVLRHRATRRLQEFIIAVSVQSYQGLQRGEVEAVKKRLAALVTVQSKYYEQRYGGVMDAGFAERFAEAKTIREDFEKSIK